MDKSTEVKGVDPFTDCGERIRQAPLSFKPKYKRLARSFYRLHLTDKKHVLAFQAYCWTMFYNTNFKCDKSLEFPHPCKYEVLILLKQPHKEAIQYVVVPADSKAGDRVIGLFCLMPAPAVQDDPIYDTLKDLWGFTQPIKSFDEPIKIKLPLSKINFLPGVLRKVCERFAKTERTAPTVYRPIELNDEPCIRLPCYSIPLQCAYRMACDHIGFLNFDMIDVWTQMDEEQEDLITIRRVVPDAAVFQVMMFWPFLEMLDLYPAERMDWILVKFRKEGSRFKAEHFNAKYKKVIRYFEYHLALELSRKSD